MTDYAANIEQAFRASSAEDLAQGLEWYGLAASYAAATADGTPYSHEQVAGVIAAMSPMMTWRSNLDVARRIIARHADGLDAPAAGYGLKRNVLKAWAILDGAEPLDVLGGLKVRSFFANIVGDSHAVTVDRWAARIARADATDAGLVSAKQYREITAAYREAAANLDVTPRDLQAAVWVYYRRLHGTNGADPS
jgi:hypothetical protein